MHKKIKERELGWRNGEFRKIADHVDTKIGRERERMRKNKIQMANSHIVSRHSSHEDRNMAKARFWVGVASHILH